MTRELLKRYRATAHKRWKEEQNQLDKRREDALNFAYKASYLLKKEFAVSEVLVFGSTVHGQWFSNSSDIDIAVSGMKHIDYFLAVAKLQDLSPEFKVDLVDLEYCKPELRDLILKESIVI
ncbi:Nucleotidyltransferase domain-containing protein [Candidatus Magnetomoraceae bacterium gMMP-15]